MNTQEQIKDIYDTAVRHAKLHEANTYIDQLRNRGKISEIEKTDLDSRIKEHYEPNTDPRIAPIEWVWVSDDYFPDFNWVCSSLQVCPGPISIWCAFVNVGKTTFLANFCVCVANGLKVFDKIEIEQPGKVLHIDFENGSNMSKTNYKRILNGYKLHSFKNIKFHQPKWKLDQQEAYVQLTKLLKDQDYKVCVIDCYSAGVPATKQNEESARIPLDMLNQVSEETKTAIILLHHEPKARSGSTNPLTNVKGSGGIIGAAGASLHLTREFGSVVCEYQIGKSRCDIQASGKYTRVLEGEFIKGINNTKAVRLVACADDADEHENPDDGLVKRILVLINESPGINTSAIKHRVKGTDNNILENLTQLIEDNLVRFDQKGMAKLHFITQDGLDQLKAFNDYGEI